MRFYSPKSKTKLLSPREMEKAKHQAEQAQHQAEQRAAKLATKLRELGIDSLSILSNIMLIELRERQTHDGILRARFWTLG
jgi:hypothetical protein